CARKTEADGTDLRVRWCPEVGAATTEDFGGRTKLRVDLESDDSFVRHAVAPRATHASPLLSPLGLRAGGLHRRRDVALERLEVVGEHLGELRRLLVVLRGVGPCAARIEHAVRHTRARRGYIEIEDRMLLVLDSIELSGERGRDHRAGVRDLHTAPDSIRAAGPAGID